MRFIEISGSISSYSDPYSGVARNGRERGPREFTREEIMINCADESPTPHGAASIHSQDGDQPSRVAEKNMDKSEFFCLTSFCMSRI